MPDSLRLAVVADIHHGADSFTKKGTAALALMAEFARFVADARPDAVIDLGDRISDVDRDTDLRLEREVADAFRAIDGLRVHVTGNHDRDHLSVADNEAILGQSLAHRTVDLGLWSLILWQADSRIRRPGGFVLPETDLLWLDATVRAATKPMLIASHVPVSGHAQIGNYYFEHNSASATYPGSERARRVLAQGSVPMMCIAGHVHWNTVTTVDGIPHLTLQSLTESFTTAPEPAAAWALLELSDTAIHWRVYGRDPFELRLEPATTTRRWVTPLPRFHELPELRDRRTGAVESPA